MDDMTNLQKRTQNITLRIVSTLIIVAQAFFSFAKAESGSWIDSIQSRYLIAARDYNMDSLRKTAEFITQRPDTERQSPNAIMLLGFIYWRLELIAFCLDNKPDIDRYGKLAIKMLQNAENAGFDIYLTASHKALANQLLASLSLINGTIFGPRIVPEIKKAQQKNPTGYYSRLVEAINFYQAPSFAGGNPEKGLLLLEELSKIFPDSIDVKIHLAQAFAKTGKKKEARSTIEPVVKKYPSNLLAAKVARGLN